ncbi:hypothetical protein [Streptomyces sp. NPDC059009]|uniref:hypothetical protein n=1 Tax=Streptomyces sp. NPDC059009 TaxID=3346694 RepID=UPI0036CF22CC
MSARTHTSRGAGSPADAGPVQIRLPWWAVALPVIAFVALLALILNPADAHAAGSEPTLAHLVDRIQETILRLAS